jgi:hypothetical protein
LLIVGILCLFGLIGLVGYDRLSSPPSLATPTASLTKDDLATELAKHNTPAGVTKDELTKALATHNTSAELARQLADAKANSDRQFQELTTKLADLTRLTRFNTWSPADRGPGTVEAVYIGNSGFGPLSVTGSNDPTPTVTNKKTRLTPEESRAISDIVKGVSSTTPSHVILTWRAERGVWEVAAVIQNPSPHPAPTTAKSPK